MVFDWMLLFAGLGGSLYVFTHARELAMRPRRGTAWRPSHRTYLLLAGVCLLIAVGALIDIVSP
jgi:hypothetical protein